MPRFLGVKLQRARRPYSRLVNVGDAKEGVSRVTTLSPRQERAEIEVYLLSTPRRSSLPPREVALLHRFSVPGTRRDDETRPILLVRARRVHGRRYELVVTADGRRIDAQTVTVPRRRGALIAGVAGVVAIIGLASLLMIGLFAPRDGGPTAPVATQTEANRAPAAAQTESTESAEPTESAAAAESSDDPEPPPNREPISESEGPAATGSAESTDSQEAVEVEAATEVEAALPETRRETVYFFPDSVALTRSGRGTLDELLTFLADHDVEEIVVEGHTALFGNEAGRAMISTGRIDAVRAYLRTNGVSPNTPIRERPRGAEAPVTRADDQQHLNRRAEIIVTVTSPRDGR